MEIATDASRRTLTRANTDRNDPDSLYAEFVDWVAGHGIMEPL